jgi:hypothetical protein
MTYWFDILELIEFRNWERAVSFSKGFPEKNLASSAKIGISISLKNSKRHLTDLAES